MDQPSRESTGNFLYKGTFKGVHDDILKRNIDLPCAMCDVRLIITVETKKKRQGERRDLSSMISATNKWNTSWGIDYAKWLTMV